MTTLMDASLRLGRTPDLSRTDRCHPVRARSRRGTWLGFYRYVHNDPINGMDPSGHAELYPWDKYRPRSFVQREALEKVVRDYHVPLKLDDPNIRDWVIAGKVYRSTVAELVDPLYAKLEKYYKAQGIKVIPDEEFRALESEGRPQNYAYSTPVSDQGQLAATSLAEFGYARTATRTKVTYTLKITRVSMYASDRGLEVNTDDSGAVEAAAITVPLPGDPKEADTLVALLDAKMKDRVDELYALQRTSDTRDTIENFAQLVPFFRAVDNFTHNKPWKLDAAIDAVLLFGPGVIGAALRMAKPTALAIVLRVGTESKILRVSEALSRVERPAMVRSIEALPEPRPGPVTVEGRSLGGKANVASSPNLVTAPQQLGKPILSLAPPLPRSPLPKSAADIPTFKSGRFADWFNERTPEELAKLFEDEKMYGKITDELRGQGGMHEFLEVAEAPHWRQWGVTAEDLWREYSVGIADLNQGGVAKGWTHSTGLPGSKAKLSTTVHNELRAIIRKSNSLAAFKLNLRPWAEKWLKDGVKSLPVALQ